MQVDTIMAAFDLALGAIATDMEQHIPRTAVRASVLKGTDKRIKLLVQQGEINVKIEVTPVLRGSVFQPETRQLSARAADAFGFASMAVLNFADLYAGKMCTALDRGHSVRIIDLVMIRSTQQDQQC